MAFPGCKSPIVACAENLYRAVDAWEPIVAGFSAQFHVGDDEESGVGRSPDAKQVFPDTARRVTRWSSGASVGSFDETANSVR